MNNDMKKLYDNLTQLFPERRTVVHGALCSVLAGEHVLLLGPPGTAKSALVRAIAQAFGGLYFERLVTKFSTPEELFGPISLKAMEADRYERITTGTLPEAEFAFVDEIYKASSAILNTLLTLANERVFHNGQTMTCPLVSLFAASNELPTEQGLEALHDRFLMRFEVGYLVRESSFRAVIASGPISTNTSLDMESLHKFQWATQKVKVTDETIDGLIEIRERCRIEGIVCSDRRWKKSLGLLKANAYLAGDKETCAEDLAILTDALWREPKERSKVARIVGQIADPARAQAIEILDAANETASRLSAVRIDDRKQYITQAAQSLEQLRQQQRRLGELGKKASARSQATFADVEAELTALHGQLAKAVSAGLGLGGAS